jgi:hypothetical protein
MEVSVMSEHNPSFNPELEARLAALAPDVAWPETPYFALGFTSSPAPVATVSRRRALVLIFALLAAIAAGLVVMSPGARSAFLEFFHLRGATVAIVDKLPETPVSSPDFGRRVTLKSAARLTGFKLVTVGRPNEVYVREHMVTLVYGSTSHPRLTLTELKGAVWPQLIKKVVGTATLVESVTVKGEPGLFISGHDHYVIYLDENHLVTDQPTFLAGTVLLWNRGPLLLRLEGELSLSKALELAGRVK